MELILRFFEWLRSWSNPKPDAPPLALPYRKKDYLLSKGEKAFFDVLYQIVQEQGWYLFCKVRLEDLLWLPAGIERKARYGLRSRVKSRHIDFVICDKANVKPLLAIELDDSSHLRFDRAERDVMVDRILSNAGLPVLHIKNQYTYDVLEVRRQIGRLTA